MNQIRTRSSTDCVFVTDLHGRADRYEKLFSLIERERPSLVFLGGDLFPSFLMPTDSAEGGADDFIMQVFKAGFARIRSSLKADYPAVLLILGNDDLRTEEKPLIEAGAGGLWTYIHQQRIEIDGTPIYGYACVPPTPFRLKDWERYDVSRFVDPGCLDPLEGLHSVPVSESELKHASIKNDLDQLTGKDDLTNAVFLFHTPPYDTCLDRAALDGMQVDHAPLDVHVGSIAVRRFIDSRQPRITLHGHIHESARITGKWNERLGRTWAFTAAHDGPELCIVRFSLEHPENATRQLY